MLEALQRGSTIEAIDAHGRGEDVSVAVPAAAGDPVPPAVAEALERGNKIEAIRLLRETTGLGLKEAKDRVDAAPQAARGASSSAAPGEVVSSSGAGWWIAAVIVAAAVGAYYLLRSAA